MNDIEAEGFDCSESSIPQSRNDQFEVDDVSQDELTEQDEQLFEAILASVLEESKQ